MFIINSEYRKPCSILKTNSLQQHTILCVLYTYANMMFLFQGRELKNDERTSITSGDGVSCLLLQNITADDSGKYDVCVENIHGADCSYASVSVEGMESLQSFIIFVLLVLYVPY